MSPARQRGHLVAFLIVPASVAFTQPPPPPPPPLGPPPQPAGNAVTTAKANLGKVLFWDEQLSSTGTVSCGTCHHATKGGSDPRSVIGVQRATSPGADNVYGNGDDVVASPGVPYGNANGTYQWHSVYGYREQVTSRKARSFIDAAYSPELFWDGRTTGTFRDPLTNTVILANGAALESQAAGPPTNDGEMAHIGRDWADVALDVAAATPLALSPSIPMSLSTWIAGRTYPQLFTEAFGTADVTPSRIIMAIATYERVTVSTQTPFDSFLGGTTTALTAQEQRGLGVFNGAQCSQCHTGGLTSDNQYHFIGVRPATDDQGRFTVSGNANDRGAFRTPTLRNVELRGPYMQNGEFATLEDVVAFYNRGGDFDAPNKDPRIRPLGLNAQQRADLVAFLKRPLTDPRVAAETTPFERPVLYTESTRMPVTTGTGKAGSGGIIPQALAIEPPIVGNPSFTVGVINARGGAQAVLVIDAVDPGPGPTIPTTAYLTRVAVTLGGTGNGNGYGSASIVIPNSAIIVGKTLYGRWYITDSGAANGVAVTPAFRFTVFGTATAAGVRGNGWVIF